MAHLVLPSVGRGHGWKPDTPDYRDIPLSKKLRGLRAIGDVVELNPTFVAKVPVRDQGQLGACHDAETEVLTEAGWRFFSDLTGNEPLATVDPLARRMIFERPTRLVRYHYIGPMVCVRNKSLDFKVTPNHQMLVRKWDQASRTLKTGFEFVRADEMGWYCGFLGSFETGADCSDTFELPARAEAHLRAHRLPRPIPMSAWLRFLGIYLAEGTICCNQRRGREEWSVQIAGSKDRERRFIAETLEALGVNGLTLKDRFTFRDRQIVEALWQLGLGGVKAGRKFVPRFVFQQSAEHIRDFLLGHFMGDGCRTQSAACHYTSSVRLADDLQALIVMSGSQSRITSRAARAAVMANGRAVNGTLPEYRISVRRRSDPSIDRNKNVLTEHYAGEVFCAEVPSFHTLVTRRNGRVLVSGNCTGFGVRGTLVYNIMKRPDLKDVELSPLFAYYRGRVAEASVNEDAGCEIRDVVKMAAQDGVALESAWPYRIEKFKKNPTATAYKTAQAHQVKVGYYRCGDSGQAPNTVLADVLQALAHDMPVTGGFACYANLDNGPKPGVIPMPAGRLEGGHAVWFVRADTRERLLKFQNSWGDWGDKGFGYLPFDYILRGWADDFWSIDHE